MAEDAGEPDELDDGASTSSAKPWLRMLNDSEKAFATYQEKADNLDKLFANLERLANNARDHQFQMFWANVQVLGPAIYSRPPVPVVVERFPQDRNPLKRSAADLLERCISVGFSRVDIDDVMRQIRDDLTVTARGVPWLRYEAKGESDSDYECVCIEHVDRKDFRHDPARKWAEVDWVAKRSWLTKAQMRKRFGKTSGKLYLEAGYAKRKDRDAPDESDDSVPKAGVWELWCKSQNKVVWVSEGVDRVLDEGKPHLKLESFFPCPRPAYATVQRRSLIPVPDAVFYLDQLEEINALTARIASLSESLKLRGFYPAGASEIADAIEAAIKQTTDNQLLIPVKNWALLGGQGGGKELIQWLPIDMVATTLTQCVELRKALIEDVYQITGLSDIMRGATEASETLGAQQLKSQYGSMRVRDRQDELVRIARDIARIAAEIMAENFSAKTLLALSQMSLPTDAEIKAKADEMVRAHEAEKRQALADPELMAKAQQNPQLAQQAIQQADQQLQAELAQLKQVVTIDAVVKLLRDESVRPFALDIETDSTIAPDENAQKQRATEFVTAVGTYMSAAVPLVTELPEAGELVAETLKYVASQFRAGRQLGGAIDDFAQKLAQRASQPQQQGPSPEMLKAQAEQQSAESQLRITEQKAQADIQKTSLENEAKQLDNAARAQELQFKADQAAHDAAHAECMRGMDAQIKTIDLAIAHSRAEQAGVAVQHAEPSGQGAPAVSTKTPMQGALGELSAQQGQIAAALAHVGNALHGLAAAHAAPKRVVFGPDGRPAGVETVTG